MNRAAHFIDVNAERPDPPPHPERQLLAAMLGGAVSDATWPRPTLSRYRSGTANPSQADQHEARAWLFADELHPWSVRWICDHLGVSVTALRRRVAEALEMGQHLDAANLLYGSRARATPDTIRAARRAGMGYREITARYGIGNSRLAAMVR